MTERSEVAAQPPEVVSSLTAAELGERVKTILPSARQPLAPGSINRGDAALSELVRRAALAEVKP